MFIIQEILSYYKSIGQQVEIGFRDQIKLHYEKNINEKLDSFTISLEIIIKNRINDDNYGLIFSTNAQHSSHYEINKKIKGLYLISDLSFANGELIDSSEEIILQPSDEQSIKNVLSVIGKFIAKQNQNVFESLVSKYNLVLFAEPHK